MDGRRNKGKVAAVIVAIAALAVAIAWQTGWLAVWLGNTEESVRVTRGENLPKAKAVNDGDYSGAGVVRAFLGGAIACSKQGAALMRDVSVSGPGAKAARKVFADACEGGGSWREKELRAKTVPVREDMEGQDSSGRVHWKVDPAGDGLPTNITLRIGDKRKGGWGIQSACVGPCGDD